MVGDFLGAFAQFVDEQNSHRNLALELVARLDADRCRAAGAPFAVRIVVAGAGFVVERPDVGRRQHLVRDRRIDLLQERRASHSATGRSRRAPYRAQNAHRRRTCRAFRRPARWSRSPVWARSVRYSLETAPEISSRSDACRPTRRNEPAPSRCQALPSRCDRLTTMVPGLICATSVRRASLAS